MRAIEPRRQSGRDPQGGVRALWERLALPIGLAAACLTIVVLAWSAVDGLREAERLVARSHADSLTALDAARGAATALAQLRAEHARLQLASNSDERSALRHRIEERHRTLAVDLGTIAARSRSVRVGQAAASAQDAADIWHAAEQLAAGGPDRTGELDRLADGAEAHLLHLAGATETHALGLRRAAESAVTERIRLIEILVGAVVTLAPVLAWLLVRRSRRGAAIEPALRVDVVTETPPAIRTPTPLEAAVAEAQDGVIVTDAERRVLYANAAAAALLGEDPEAPTSGQPPAPILAPLFAANLPERAHDIVRADGRRLHVSCSALPDGTILHVVGDVTARRRREASTERTVDTLRTAIDAMSQGLCVYDAAHRLVLANRRYAEIYRHEPGSLEAGLTATEVLERSLAAGNHAGSTLQELLGEAERILARSDADDDFQELADGRVIRINVGPTADGGFVATYDDVTERWHADSRIAYMARHDGLTDLPNRVLLAERIEGAITQARRDAGFAVHCLDLDNFKQVNDTLGHAVGDELLRAVAHRLTACLRDVDTVARLGGDEFAIVQAGVEKSEDAAVLARHVIEVVGAPYDLTEHTVTIGVSVGIALAPSDGMAPDRLLKNADVALYKSKDDGRGVFRFFEAEMDARLQARRLLEIDLRAALAAEAFELHYQPIYDLSQDRISGFEALLRWTHPTRGRVSPAEFVPLAEEIGLIVPLGEWVLRTACAEASRWPGHLKIAVNVSPAQFHSAQLVRTVRAALAETGLTPSRLELEITENVLLASRGATVAILHALRSMGTRIAMDDFGTGYSSLSYLRSFPFDKMKVDQSFIRDLTAEQGSGFIVQAVISLGTNLGMTMTAEGVETEDQLARLRDEGCDEAQGYLFSPPVPASRIAGLLERWNGTGAAARAA